MVIWSLNAIILSLSFRLSYSYSCFRVIYVVMNYLYLVKAVCACTYNKSILLLIVYLLNSYKTKLFKGYGRIRRKVSQTWISENEIILDAVKYIFWLGWSKGLQQYILVPFVIKIKSMVCLNDQGLRRFSAHSLKTGIRKVLSSSPAERMLYKYNIDMFVFSSHNT